jgi:hypothetical protein
VSATFACRGTGSIISLPNTGFPNDPFRFGFEAAALLSDGFGTSFKGCGSGRAMESNV